MVTLRKHKHCWSAFLKTANPEKSVGHVTFDAGFSIALTPVVSFVASQKWGRAW
jgi:hypothetical protein